MTVFEQILYNYGPCVLTCVRNVCQENELYEECADINTLFARYGVDANMSVEDWKAEFWKLGTSGETAIKNAPFYFLEAIQLCKDNGVFKNLKS